MIQSPPKIPTFFVLGSTPLKFNIDTQNSHILSIVTCLKPIILGTPQQKPE